MSLYDNDLYGSTAPSAIDYARLGVGLVARGIFWLCALFIVGNAVVLSFKTGNPIWGIFEASVFPATFFIHPFAAPSDALAWPFADGTSFIPFWIAAMVAYPVSTVVGGLAPVDR